MAKSKKEVKGHGMKFTDPRKDNTNAFDLKGKLYLKDKTVFSDSHGFGKIIEVRQEDNDKCMVWVHFDEDCGPRRTRKSHYNENELQLKNGVYYLPE